MHHKPAVHHKLAPRPEPAHAVVPRAPAVVPVRTLASTASAASSDGTRNAKLLLALAVALLLVAAAGASLLRLLVQIGRPRRGW